jgi:hypothetical protein
MRKWPTPKTYQGVPEGSYDHCRAGIDQAQRRNSGLISYGPHLADHWRLAAGDVSHSQGR